MVLLGLHPGIEELLLAAVIVFTTALIYKFLMNQDEVRDIKKQQKEKQAKMKEVQKTDPDEVNKLTNELLKLSNKQFRMMMKPMMVSLIVVGLILSWMSQAYGDFIISLPFAWPSALSWFIGVQGWFKPWLAWYILVSIPLNSIFRKILGVEL